MSNQNEERSLATGPSSYDRIAALSESGPAVPQPEGIQDAEGDSSFDQMTRLHGSPPVEDVNRALPDDDRRVVALPGDQFEKMISAIVKAAARGGIAVDELWGRIGEAMALVDPYCQQAPADAVAVYSQPGARSLGAGDLIPGVLVEFEHPGLVEVWAVFDGPLTGRKVARFVGVEDVTGETVNVDGWAEGSDGTWRLGPFLASPRLPDIPEGG